MAKIPFVAVEGPVTSIEKDSDAGIEFKVDYDLQVFQPPMVSNFPCSLYSFLATTGGMLQHASEWMCSVIFKEGNLSTLL
jgi:hypothetical protein